MKKRVFKGVISTALVLSMVLSVSAVSLMSASAASPKTELGVSDEVLISKYSGTEVKIQGEVYGILR